MRKGTKELSFYFIFPRVMADGSLVNIRSVPDDVDQKKLNELEDRGSIVGEYRHRPTVGFLRENLDTHFIADPVPQPHECEGCSELRERVKSLQKDNVELKKDNVELKMDNVELKKDLYIDKVYLCGQVIYEWVCQKKIFPMIEDKMREDFGLTDWEEVKGSMSKKHRDHKQVRAIVNDSMCKLLGAVEVKPETVLMGILGIIRRRIDIAHPTGTSLKLVGRLEEYMKIVEDCGGLKEGDKVNFTLLHMLLDYVSKEKRYRDEDDEWDL
eukprot:TRINITY_DN834_c0_g1_i17.p1 TRINITY_DN834_c0_g1~~TRINITY_DN834_c0_g1_i17.p1  ORF type:complete len:269 (-),score=66.73 TRINITY_DN834_c0_g1_i17:659-1465(-)